MPDSWIEQNEAGATGVWSGTVISLTVPRSLDHAPLVFWGFVRRQSACD
jgi:hypothetical protein